MLGKVAGVRGEYRQAFDFATSSLAIAEEIEHLQWMTAANSLLGHLYLDLLSADDSRRHLERAHDLAGLVSSIWWLQRVASQLALALIIDGDLEPGGKLLDEAFPPGLPARTLGQSLVVYARIELALAGNRPDEARSLVDLVDSPASDRDPQFTALRARVQAALGNHGDAERIYVPLIERLRIKRLRPLLWRTEAHLGALYAATGRIDEATARFEAAKKIADEIASDIPDQNLRSVFIEQAALRIPDGAWPTGAP